MPFRFNAGLCASRIGVAAWRAGYAHRSDQRTACFHQHASANNHNTG